MDFYDADDARDDTICIYILCGINACIAGFLVIGYLLDA